VTGTKLWDVEIWVLACDRHKTVGCWNLGPSLWQAQNCGML